MRRLFSPIFVVTPSLSLPSFVLLSIYSFRFPFLSSHTSLRLYSVVRGDIKIPCSHFRCQKEKGECKIIPQSVSFLRAIDFHVILLRLSLSLLLCLRLKFLLLLSTTTTAGRQQPSEEGAKNHVARGGLCFSGGNKTSEDVTCISASILLNLLPSDLHTHTFGAAFSLMCLFLSCNDLHNASYHAHTLYYTTRNLTAISFASASAKTEDAGTRKTDEFSLFSHNMNIRGSRQAATAGS